MKKQTTISDKDIAICCVDGLTKQEAYERFNLKDNKAIPVKINRFYKVAGKLREFPARRPNQKATQKTLITYMRKNYSAPERVWGNSHSIAWSGI